MRFSALDIYRKIKEDAFKIVGEFGVIPQIAVAWDDEAETIKDGKLLEINNLILAMGSTPTFMGLERLFKEKKVYGYAYIASGNAFPLLHRAPSAPPNLGAESSLIIYVQTLETSVMDIYNVVKAGDLFDFVQMDICGTPIDVTEPFINLLNLDNHGLCGHCAKESVLA